MCKISVIMPAYNVEQYIEKSIKSVLNQTMNDFELIVVDDGSIDRTLEIIKNMQKNDARISLIENHHSGVSIARHCGLNQAIGEWIFFIDSDDLLAPWTFEHLLDAAKDEIEICKIAGIEFKKEEEIHFEDPGLNIRNTTTKTGIEMCAKLCNEKEFTGSTLLWGRIIRKRLFENPDIAILFSDTVMGKYPYNFLEDVIIGARLVAVAKLVREFPEIGYFHRINEKGLSHSLEISDYKYEQIRATGYSLKFYQEKGWNNLLELQLISGYFLVMSLYYKAHITEKKEDRLIECVKDTKEFDEEFKTLLPKLFFKEPLKIIYIFVWRHFPRMWLKMMSIYFQERRPAMKSQP